MLEERVGSAVTTSYVWSPVYVDAMVARDRDTDANGSLDERLYAVHDANFNVVALIDTTGAVVERYAYDAFGGFNVLNGSWGSRPGSSYAWTYLHHGGRWDIDGGLYSFRNREYSPSLGRWMQVDPIGFRAGDVNLFRFSGNPINAIDPLGLETSDTGTLDIPGNKDRGFKPAKIKYDIDIKGCCKDGEGKKYLGLITKAVESAFKALQSVIYDISHVSDPKSTMPKDKRDKFMATFPMYFRPTEDNEQDILKKVKDTYSRMANGLIERGIKIRCGKACKEGWMGYTDPLDTLFGGNTVHLCPGLFKVDPTIIAHTIVHELSHLYGGTRDHGYFQEVKGKNVWYVDGKGNLKVFDSDELVVNADTYAVFLEALDFFPQMKK